MSDQIPSYIQVNTVYRVRVQTTMNHYVDDETKKTKTVCRGVVSGLGETYNIIIM